MEIWNFIEFWLNFEISSTKSESEGPLGQQRDVKAKRILENLFLYPGHSTNVTDIAISNLGSTDNKGKLLSRVTLIIIHMLSQTHNLKVL